MDRIIEVKVGGNYLSKDNSNAGVQYESNVTNLRIIFDEGWDGYAKKVTFWDAKGANPVERTLTADLLEDITKSTRVYLCPIPGEPMAESGWFTFVIDGYADGKRQRSISDKLRVKPAPFKETAGQPVDPTPTQAEQLQSQIDDLLPKIVLAGQVAENETERILAESVRTAAEQDRSAAEQKRLEEERNRISNEEARQSAESGRTVEEAKRVTAEQNRITAEQARAAAETQRIAAETDRQSKSSAMQVWEDYDSARAYVPLNKVVWNGSSYICIQACTGVTPDNGDYWLMIARKGVDGTTVNASGQYSFAVENGHLILYYTGEMPPDFSIDENGHLILHFDDTHTMDIGAVIGPPGPAGLGVPAGGTAGQVLTKSSSDDYATKWSDQSSGGDASGAVAQHNVSDAAHSDIRLLIQGLSERLSSVADSDDATLDQLSEIVAYIKSNKSLIDAITTSKVNVADIVDNLTTNVANKPLSAAQGVALKAIIDALTIPTALSDLTDDTTHRVVTDAEKAVWNAKSNFTGSYNDLTDKPTIPAPYILPIASHTVLGGVQPVAKTNAMTQSVGVDEAGALWAPAGGGGSSGGGFETLIDFTTEEAVTEFTIPNSVVGPVAAKIMEASTVYVYLYVPKYTDDTETSTIGTAKVINYMGWDSTLFEAKVIPAPTTGHINWRSVSVIFHKIPVVAGVEIIDPQYLSMLRVITDAIHNANSSAPSFSSVYASGLNWTNSVNGYIKVTGTQTMAAGTRFVLGVTP